MAVDDETVQVEENDGRKYDQSKLEPAGHGEEV